MQNKLPRLRRGSTAILAMMFLVLFSTLAFAMFSMSTLNTQSASNLSDVQRARSAAESGLRWMSYRFFKMARPKTTTGTITASVADSLWTSITTAIQTDFSNLVTTSERTLTLGTKSITTATINADGDNTTFKLQIQQHPLFVGDTLDQRYIRVTSTGLLRPGNAFVIHGFPDRQEDQFRGCGQGGDSAWPQHAGAGPDRHGDGGKISARS